MSHETNARQPENALQDQSNERILSPETMQRVHERIESLMKGGGGVMAMIASHWSGELRWARNRATMTSDRRDVQVFVMRLVHGGVGNAMTNQIDDESLAGVVRSAEWQAARSVKQDALDMALDPRPILMRESTTWNDVTFARTSKENATFVQRVRDVAEQKDLLSAGYLEARAGAFGYLNVDVYGRKPHPEYYTSMTQAQCTVTVRHPKGTGSGWAGLSSYDIQKISHEEIAQRAMDKCIASLNPVRIEPGRYTTILEPQAVASLIDVFFEGSAMARWMSEDPAYQQPFFLGRDQTVNRFRSKLGQRVVDERITISHNPSDPDLGTVSVPGLDEVKWIENGVLKALDYKFEYALDLLNENEFVHDRKSYRVSGGTTSIEEMIETTKRGLFVSRLSPLRVLDNQSLLSTGVTRDGLWLIENGKITKAVRNFRITESPLFALNNIEQLGVPVPVFHSFPTPEVTIFAPHLALMPAIVPPMKVRDFSFTSTIDAI